MSYQDEHRYDDIINLPHHVSDKHPHMDLLDRAAQFSPFAALTGHGAAVEETARLTHERIELDEDTKEMLDACLQLVREHLPENPEVTFTYFLPDERKSGGAYVTVTDRVKKIDEHRHVIILNNGDTILIDELVAIEGDILSNHSNF